MNFYFIGLSVLFIFFNTPSSLNVKMIKERIELDSYLDCIKLRIKAPTFNLRCENILDNFNSNKEKVKHVKDKTNKKGIKMLTKEVAHFRKVEKNEENKLRHLYKKLTNEDKLLRD